MKLRLKLVAPLAALAFCTAFAPVALADDAAVRKDMMTWVKDAEDKMLQLADATPEAKYSWRPGKGVRSTAEVFMHVAAANYGVPSFFGVAPPEGFEFAKFEGSATKKEDVVKHLKKSFAHMEKGFDALAEGDMEKPVKLFNMEMTTRSAYMLLLSHAHEHLGQSIAYARMNGIVPPWSRTPTKAAEEPKAEETKKGGM